jgi:tetratricopeptide (TPR) repeat protein
MAIALNLLLLSGLAAGLAWLFVYFLKRSDDPPRFLFKWLLTLLLIGALIWLAVAVGYNQTGAFVVPIACVIFGVVFSIIWAPHIARAFAKPLTSIFDGGDVPPDPAPQYSSALGKIKRGQYQEAAFDIKRQLLQFPTDLQGQTLLAQLQAEHLNDLPGAQVTLERLAAQPGHTRRSIVFAFTQLSEWHLKYAQDIEAARLALEKVIELFPETEEAQMAYQRLANLTSTEQLLEAVERHPIHLTPGVKNVGLLKHSSTLQPPEFNPVIIVAELVGHLEQFPLDHQAREKLACAYAEHYHRLDLAVDHLEQLLKEPNVPAKSVVHWLNLIADLQIKFGLDEEAARQSLQRILDLYPDTSAAELTRQRLATLPLELKGQQPTSVVKLGAYEQNIGLKGHRPKQDH